MESIFLYLREIKKDLEYSIKIGRANDYLRTPSGQTIKSSNKILVEHIISELQAFHEIDIEDNAICGEPLTSITAYSLISTEIDFVSEKPRWSLEEIEQKLSNDPLRQLSPGPEKVDQMYQWRNVISYLEESGIDFYKIQYYDNEQSDRLAEFFKDKVEGFKNCQIAVFNNLLHLFNSALSAIAFADGKIKPSELASIYMNTGEGRFSAEMGDEEEYNSNFRTIFDQIRDVGVRCETYLNLSIKHKSPEEILISEIEKGETTTLEFKSTLRQNLHTGKNDDEITHSCLKTITAFLNTAGGKLLIGVSDKGEIVGIEKDGFPDNDKYQLHLFNLIKEYLGNNIASLVNAEMVEIGKKFICLVKCDKSPQPVYLKFKKRDEEYFIRTGPGSTKLSTSEAHKYINEKFKQ
jgi:chaperone required for assembly of F1-ATPase